MRLGLELSYSGDPATGSVTVTKKLWAECYNRIDDSTNSTSIQGVGGTFSGSRVYDFPGNYTTLNVWTGTSVESLAYGATTVKNADASVSGIEYIGSGTVASVAASITLPARPLSKPANPSNFVNTRNSDAQNTLTWANNPTTAAPYSTITITRSVDGQPSTVMVSGLAGTATSWVDNSTSPDHSYAYTIWVYNSAGASPGLWSNTTYNTPAAPSGCGAAKDGSDVVVSWTDNSRHETGFQVWESVNGGAYSLLTTTAAGAETYRRTGVVTSSSYRYKVRAAVGGVTSAFSNESDVIPAGPASPTNVAVDYVSDARLDVSWTNNATVPAPYVSLSVQRNYLGTSVWSTVASGLGPTVTSWSDTTTVADRRYRYRVVAVNESGSATSAASGYQETTPNGPTGVTASWSGSNIVLNWTDHTSVETAYQVWESTDGGATYGLLATLGANATAYTHYGPSTSVPHTYRVRAVGASGETVYSPYSAATTMLPAAPAAPGTATATRVSDTQTTVGWSNNSSTLAPYASLSVQRWDNVTGSWYTVKSGLSASSVTYADTSTVANRRYQYRVVAVNATGSATGAVSGLLDTTPAAPSNCAAVKVGTDVVVSWTDNATNEASHEVWHSEGGGAYVLLATVAGTSYTHTSPNSAATHAYKVRAKATSGGTLYSAYSAPSGTVQLLTAPNAPSGLTGGVFDATGTVPVTWVHNPVDTTAQTAYEVQYRVQGAPSWSTTGTVLSSSAGRTFSANTFVNGTSIEYQVRTKGQHPDWSPWSASQVFVLTAKPVATLVVPNADAYPVSAPYIDVEWSYFDAEGKGQAQYRVSLYDAADTLLRAQTGVGGATSARIEYLLEDGLSYRVALTVWDGDGLASDEVTYTIDVAYALPTVPVLDVTFDTGTGMATLAVTNPEPTTEPDVVYNAVYRRLGTEAWVLLGEVGPNGNMTDYTAPVGVEVAYRVEAWTALPSLALGADVVVTFSAPGKVYINAGPSLSLVAVLEYEQDISTGYRRDVVAEQYAGRTKPVLYEGMAEQRVVDVGGLFTDRARRATLEAVLEATGVHLYRDCFGRRMFCAFLEGYTIAEGSGGTFTLKAKATEVDER